MQLKPGQKVIHPNHGITTVAEVTSRAVGGTERTYVVLERPQEHLRLLLPEDELEELGLRRVIDPDEVDDILAVLEQKTDAADASWRGLRAKNEARLSSGDPIRIAEVVRDLSSRGAARDLSMTDRRLLDRARARLANEFEAALDVEDGEAILDEKLEGIERPSPDDDTLAA